MQLEYPTYKHNGVFEKTTEELYLIRNGKSVGGRVIRKSSTIQQQSKKKTMLKYMKNTNNYIYFKTFSVTYII